MKSKNIYILSVKASFTFYSPYGSDDIDIEKLNDQNDTHRFKEKYITPLIW